MHLNTTEAYEIAKQVLNIYYQENLNNLNKFESLYKKLEDIDLIVNYKIEPIVTSELLKNAKEEEESQNSCHCINYIFYEGFGIPI